MIVDHLVTASSAIPSLIETARQHGSPDAIRAHNLPLLWLV